ncbi:MAG: acyltransferase [Bacteroidaceae bacterium]|nr:acyltransferase [Bacteroidaceae bacterium]
MSTFGQTFQINAEMSNRNYTLDVIRTIAILFVVANHAIEMSFPFHYKTNGYESFCGMPYTLQFFQFFVFTMGRLGVPLFFMLTGYLLLTRGYDTKEKIVKFYKKKFLGLIMVWYVWILLYNVFFLLYAHKPFIIKDILLEMLFIKIVPLMHAWYMNEFVIIYALIPVLSYVLMKIGHARELIIGILTVSIIYVMVGGISHATIYVYRLMYIAYVIAGYYFAVIQKHPGEFICMVVFVIGLGVIIGWQIHGYHNHQPSSIWYSNPLLYITSFSLFSLLLTHKWNKGRFSSYVETISRISFGIYLLHVPVMRITISLIPSLKDMKIINVVFLFLITFSTCTLIILMISKMSRIGKLLFYMK